MKKKNLIKVRESLRTLYYRPARKSGGVCATLAGYRKGGRDYWYL